MTNKCPLEHGLCICGHESCMQRTSEQHCIIWKCRLLEFKVWLTRSSSTMYPTCGERGGSEKAQDRPRLSVLFWKIVLLRAGLSDSLVP